MLTNTLPAQTSTKYADISSTELAAAGGYTAGGKAVGFTGLTSAQSSGIYKLVLPDVIFTATAAMGPFRYAVLYNDGDTTTPKGLIGFWDNGAPVTLANTETFTVDFDGTTGVMSSCNSLPRRRFVDRVSPRSRRWRSPAGLGRRGCRPG